VFLDDVEAILVEVLDVHTFFDHFLNTILPTPIVLKISRSLHVELDCTVCPTFIEKPTLCPTFVEHLTICPTVDVTHIILQEILRCKYSIVRHLRRVHEVWLGKLVNTFVHQTIILTIFGILTQLTHNRLYKVIV